MNKYLFLLLTVVFFTACSGGKDKAVDLYMKGKEFYYKQDLSKALKYFEEAEKLDKNFLNASLMIAKIYYFNKKFPESLDKTKSILKKDENNTGALYWKAKTISIMQTKNPDEEKTNDDEIIRCLLRVLEADSHHIAARSLLALVYEKKKMYKEAFSEYQLVLQEEETLVNARANLGILYSRLGLKEKALDEIDSAIKIANVASVEKKNLIKIRKEIK